MNEIKKIFDNKINLFDRILFIFLSLIPISLAISIFVADLLSSISGIILLTKFLERENTNIFKSIKYEIIFFLILYSIILISFFFTEYKEYSFLASFFYFRYFLLSLALFYLLKKYDFFSRVFYKLFLISIFIVIADSFFQYIFGYNFFGYEKIIRESGDLIYLSSFFNEEKKLGSYLVRFLPLILSLIYLSNKKISTFYEATILLLVTIIIFLSSERTAMFLLIIIYIFYFFIQKKRIFFIIPIIIIFFILFNFERSLVYKYLTFTLNQTGLSLITKPSQRPIFRDIVRYYSYEHENLSYTGLKAFRENFLFGTGVKTFYPYCRDNNKKYQFNDNKRKNRLVCSTHPHNTYVQILSEIGIFGFLLIVFLFFKTLSANIKIFFINKKNNLIKSYYFLNLSIIINIMPFIPSGSFFNNWLSLMMFFPIGYWFYIKDKFKNNA